MRLYGKRPIVERLRVAPKTVKTLYLKQGVDNPEVVQAAKAANLQFVAVPKPEFYKLAGEIHSQGAVAEVDDFLYTPLEEILRKTDKRPSLFFLDRVTDPQNLGSILRTTACLGEFVIVIPKHESAEINETVLRVACGGENFVPVALVTNLVRACEQAKKAGYWIAGAASSGEKLLHSADWPTPLGVVLGSEGSGIRPGLEKHLALTLSIPMPGAGLSYNVATAAALIAYEITRRRLAKEKF